MERQDNTGSLWAEGKEKVSAAGKPYTIYGGDMKLDGKEYWINAFLNETKTGKKVYDLKFKPKEQTTSTPAGF